MRDSHRASPFAGSLLAPFQTVSQRLKRSFRSSDLVRAAISQAFAHGEAEGNWRTSSANVANPVVLCRQNDYSFKDRVGIL
jgi:hypothetical protein